MTLMHIQTTVLNGSIRMHLANNASPELATESIDFTVPTGAHLTVPNSTGHENPLGDIAVRQLATIQLATLRYVQELISKEVQRLNGISRA